MPLDADQRRTAKRRRGAHDRAEGPIMEVRRGVTAPRREQRGRVWLNGHELGEPGLRFGHLSNSYD